MRIDSRKRAEKVGVTYRNGTTASDTCPMSQSLRLGKASLTVAATREQEQTSTSKTSNTLTKYSHRRVCGSMYGCVCGCVCGCVSGCVGLCLSLCSLVLLFGSGWMCVVRHNWAHTASNYITRHQSTSRCRNRRHAALAIDYNRTRFRSSNSVGNSHLTLRMFLADTAASSAVAVGRDREVASGQWDSNTGGEQLTQIQHGPAVSLVAPAGEEANAERDEY